jgi:hypothetical protein
MNSALFFVYQTIQLFVDSEEYIGVFHQSSISDLLSLFFIVKRLNKLSLNLYSPHSNFPLSKSLKTFSSSLVKLQSFNQVISK